MTTDFDAYEAALERGVPRQLARARYNIVPDAFDQLEEAFIFHTRCAWDTLKWYVKALVTGRCTACGMRHWKTLRIDHPSGGGLTCGYGWRPNVWRVFRTAWFAGKHGED